MAQLNPERLAFGRLLDGKWESSNRLLRKSLNKDQSNLEANYVMSRWYFASENPAFNIDSAFYYSQRTIWGYDSVTIKEKEKLEKFPLDSLIIITIKNKIDSAAFDRARNLNTEEAYIKFIEKFASAKQIPDAIDLRNEVSFLEALRINTYQQYKAYLDKYPQSARAFEASSRYEKLLFEEKTKGKKLSDFKSFIERYPTSPYKSKAEQEVFELTTASGSLADFETFIKQNPDNPYVKHAVNMMFHVYKFRDEAFPKNMLTDSLQQVLRIESSAWIPFLKNGKFGFMDFDGKEMLPPKFAELADEYKCEPLMSDVIKLPEGYYSRVGYKYADANDKFVDIGLGYISVLQNGCARLFHKSGKIVIGECHDEYKLVGENFIGAGKGDNFWLYTLAGRKLNLSISDANEQEGLFILTRDGRKVINRASQLAGIAQGDKLNDDFIYDDVITLDRNLLLVKLSGMEGILQSDLTFKIPLDRHTLTRTDFGYQERSISGIKLIGLTEDVSKSFWQYAEVRHPWLMLRKDESQKLYHLPSKKMVTDYDSIWFEQGLAFVKQGNQQRVYFSSNRSIDIQSNAMINFIVSRDSIGYFYTTTKNKRNIYSAETGDQILSTEFVPDESIEGTYFIVSKGNKKGIISAKNKVIVPVEMDIIIRQENHLSIVKDKKFGLFDLSRKRYIKPIYERNITPLNDMHLIAFKDGNAGIVSYENKQVTNFEFEEIMHWNDSLIWVKSNHQWQLINYLTKTVIINHVKSFTSIMNTPDEKIIKIFKDNYFGVLSNVRGMIIPPTFTAITNLGTKEVPFYFTEKFIEEAAIYIVVYYNRDGVLVRKQAYEEEEYDRLVCDDR